MKNTSILIPIVLIGCLVALGFLFFKAFQTVENDPLRTNPRIVLDERDYADDPPPADLGGRADYDAPPVLPPPPVEDPDEVDGPGTRLPAQTSEGFRELTPAERDAARRDFAARQPANDPDVIVNVEIDDRRDDPAAAPSYDGTPAAPTSPTTPGVTEPAGSGRYLVIAGTFRMENNAVDRVGELRRAGFSNSRVEPFNRGTYAVALAGQSDSYNTAQGLAARIKRAGFEVEVMRRR